MSEPLIVSLLEEKFKKNRAYVKSSDSFYYLELYGSDDNKDYIDFLKKLNLDLSKPIINKSFNFCFNDMKSLKNHLLGTFVKKATMDDFQNTYHSFFKFIPLSELFKYFYIRPDSSGKIKLNHQYEPYILFLLKQDFSHQKSASYCFSTALSFNFKATSENYLDLKESIFTFLNNHYEKARALHISEYNPEKIKKFDLDVYEKVKKHIKEPDLKQFEKFWSSIIIKEEASAILSAKENCVVFNMEHAYLTKNYPSVTNSAYAKKACIFMVDTLNKHYSNELNMSIISESDLMTQIVCEFKNFNLTLDNLQILILSAMEIHEECKVIKNISAFKNYTVSDTYKNKINEMDIKMKYFTFKNTMPSSSTSKKPAIKI